MDLLYVHNAVFPQPVANRYQVINMCQAFSQEGVHTTLLTSGSDAGSILDYYAVRTPFAVDCVRPQQHHARRTFQYLTRILARYRQYSNLYTRDIALAVTIKTLFPTKRVVYEVHDYLESPLWRRLYRRAARQLDAIVAISSAIPARAADAGCNAANTIIAEDGVDMERFDIPITRDEARRQLGLPLDRTLIVYVGSTTPDRDLDTLISVVRKRPDTLVAIFGVERASLRDPCAILAGLTRAPEVAMKAADVLFFGLTSQCRTIPYMSPLKLFEYMAAKRPIIAVDFPRVREVVGPEGAAFYESCNHASLADAIEQALRPAHASRIDASFARAGQHAWRHRARAVLQPYLAAGP